MIPTYNEPLHVVRATVLGAVALDFIADKFKVFVLDDGRREEFGNGRRRSPCTSRAVPTRTRSRQHQPRAEHTSAEYVAIFG
jgi:cellulose synthase (UDP-forming)